MSYGEYYGAVLNRSFQIFKQLARRLLQGKALSIEDAADALSLKDNAEEEKLKDYVTALRLLVNAEVRLTHREASRVYSALPKIPQARKLAAFRSVWRRIYLHDKYASYALHRARAD